MTASAKKHQYQVAARLHPQDFATIVQMAETMPGATRESLVRDLVSQGIVALRAAAGAEDAGQDRDAAAVEALRLNARLDRMDGDVTKHWLDMGGAHFDAVWSRDPVSSILQESGSISVLKNDLKRREQAYGMTAAEIMAEIEMADVEKRLAAHEALAERLVVRDDVPAEG